MSNQLTECQSCKPGSLNCPKPHHLSSGGKHWYSGWPGAFCLGCGADDPAEACITECNCKCHDAFWAEYDAYCENEEKK